MKTLSDFSLRSHFFVLLPVCTVLVGLGVGPAAWAQSGAGGQVVKPPIATAYMDVATSASDIPGMGAMAGAMRGAQDGGGLFGALGGLVKGGMGGSGGNVFGNTKAGGMGAPGKYVDISVGTLQNPTLQTAEQQIQPPFGLASPLKLVSPPPPEKPEPVESDDKVVEPTYEKPKGKISLYWGCGDTVRPGQPRTLDMANAGVQDIAKFFVMRNSTTRGARLRAGEPSWPNKVDDRRVPDTASLLGAHTITGEGIPEGFQFTLDERQDLMAPLELTQQAQGGAVQLGWKAVAHARGYFISVLGAKGRKGGGEEGAEVVIWTSSELPEMGYALVDYQTNASVDKWVKEKVVLPPSATHCTVPKGIFGQEGAGMLRMIAYGSESYFAHPPRPKDVKKPWEPQWQAKVRTKSTLFSMLGGMPGGRAPADEPREAPEGDATPQPEPSRPSVPGMPGVGGLLKGLFGK